jgi:hypothetical protein
MTRENILKKNKIHRRRFEAHFITLKLCKIVAMVPATDGL